MLDIDIRNKILKEAVERDLSVFEIQSLIEDEIGCLEDFDLYIIESEAESIKEEANRLQNRNNNMVKDFNLSSNKPLTKEQEELMNLINKEIEKQNKRSIEFQKLIEQIKK